MRFSCSNKDTLLYFTFTYMTICYTAAPSKVKVSRSSDMSDKCWPISRKRIVPETLKLVGRLRTPQEIISTSFKVNGQRSRSSGRSTNAETGSASYLPKVIAWEFQTWYTYGVWKRISWTSVPRSPRSKVKILRSRDASDKSRRKRSRNINNGRKVAYPTGNIAHQFQGQRSKFKVTRLINAETGSTSYLQNWKAYEVRSIDT